MGCNCKTLKTQKEVDDYIRNTAFDLSFLERLKILVMFLIYKAFKKRKNGKKLQNKG